MELDKVLGILLDTSTGTRLGEVQKLYSRLDREQKDFSSLLGIGCNQGCGTCCENYFPDITNAEAEYMAMGILLQGNEKEVLEKLHSIKDRRSCPLYIKDRPYHCSVYSVRPLICRLFGNSVTKDKNDRPVFRDCRWKENPRIISAEELERLHDRLVIMENYGIQLEEIQPEDNATYPLDEALERAIYKIKFLLQLDDDNPEPEPNAS